MNLASLDHIQNMTSIKVHSTFVCWFFMLNFRKSSVISRRLCMAFKNFNSVNKFHNVVESYDFVDTK